MNRARIWYEEICNRYPFMNPQSANIMADFIAIFEEMGGFDNGAYIQYFFIFQKLLVMMPDFSYIMPSNNDGELRLRYVYIDTSVGKTIFVEIEPDEKYIREFLDTYWHILFPEANIKAT